jgi:hypothetical protein
VTVPGAGAGSRSPSISAGATGAASAELARVPRRARARWVAFSAAAALAALLVLVLWKREAIVAWLSPAPIVPDDAPFTLPRVDRRAAALREDALGACAAREFARCAAGLDEARRLDPAGEADPQVAAARRAIAGAVRLDGAVPQLLPPNDKPGVEKTPR